ncbi:hypothetical protein PUV54_03155 [Hyphococcus flavus]|uniref:Uncharacterized protein n=1 Tax=Hyphococcus flavus TaxID=1866326 RepID=A0AAF0CGB8_9PROT|nr:hypothetical protein [Hyphococcus flavus]WDI32189.1 hypothetical protein PUV54_03155 [Hyphococcus flavus]
MLNNALKISAITLCAAGLGACGTTSGAPGGGSSGGGTPPSSYVGDVDDFYDALAQRESSGNASVENSYGYLGLYQMGEPAMMDAQWYDETAPSETSANDWIGSWLTRAQNNSVYSKNDYLNRPGAQDVAVRQYHDRVAVYISALDLLRFEGDIINGVEITRSGLLAACHLLGCGTVEDYLEAPGSGTPADAYGTTIEEYLSLFANYETDF